MTSLREEAEPGAAASDVPELLKSAQLLLRQAGHLDALLVLHGAIQQALGDADSGSLPPRYHSLSEARLQHARLSALEAATAVPLPAGPLRELLRRRPPWFSRALTLAVVLCLVLRYAWAAKHHDWHQQNPEGDWVSRFYPSSDFQGYPLVRYDVGVNYDFGTNGAADSMPKDWFSARWDTCIIVAQDVTLSLRLRSDDGATLWLDGASQIKVDPGPGETAAEVVLRQGMRHLCVDLIERAGAAYVQLEGLEGAEAVRFQRPVLEGNDVRCQ